jgi:hypothetical protein
MMMLEDWNFGECDDENVYWWLFVEVVEKVNDVFDLLMLKMIMMIEIF